MKIQLSLSFALLIFLLTPPIFSEPGSSSSPSIKTFVKRVSGGGSLLRAIQGGNDTYISLSQKGEQDFLVRKTKTTAGKVWERKLHFDDGYPITLKGIAQTSDGGYVLAGSRDELCYFYCYGAPSFVGILVKLRSNGSIEWKKAYSSNGLAFYFTSVVSNSDGGFTAAGYANDHLELVKFTSAGDVVWIKTLTDPKASGYRLVPTFDNGYMLVSRSSRTSNTAHVIKLNNSGTVLWTKSLKIEGFAFQTALVTSDHRVIFAFAKNCRECNRVALVALQSDGTVSWEATYFDSYVSSSPSTIRDLIETPDGGFVILSDRSLLRIDSLKNIVFNTTAGGIFVFNSKDGGILIFGQSMQISKVNSKGGASCRTTSIPASKLPQSPLKTGRPKISELTDSLLLGVKDIAVTSTATSLPLITVCQ